MTTSGHDTANRRTTVTDPLGRVTTTGYDAVGRVTTVTTPAGTTTNLYDAAGQLKKVTRPSGAFTQYAYDPRGLLTTVTGPLGNVTTYAYDNAGQQTGMTDPRTYTTSYQYDGAGRQTRITDALTGQVNTAYDAAGQVTSITNARGKVTSYTYDSLGNQLTETDPLGRVTTNVYDLAGRLTSTTDPRAITVSYTYDNANRLTTMTYPGGTVTTSYDTAGRRTQMVDATGTTAWAYDAARRTTSVTSPQGVVSYTYNAAGQRATMTQPGNRTVTYAYDTAGRLASLTDWGNRTTTFGYNADSQRTTVTRPGPVTTTNTYNAAGWLTGVAHTKNATTLQSFTYTYDAAGNRTSQVGPNGTESYTLDALGRLTSATIPTQGTTTYTYDANGNRLTRVNGGTTTNYTYDDADQLTIEGTTAYTYDNAGNMTAKGTSTYAYDWRGRMTSATVAGTTTTFTYDGTDVRVKKQTGATTTTYLWDRESGLPLIIDDGTNGYVHTGTGDPLTQTGLSSGTPKWLLTDGLGSVRGAANATGSLTGSANYDTFGAPYGTDSTGSKFGFTGEQRDSETGFEYLRARYYNPANGRFSSRDSLFPAGEGTQGYNRYAYAGNNPTTYTDPSGHAATGGGVALTLPTLWYACMNTIWCKDAVLTSMRVAGASLAAFAAGSVIGGPAIQAPSALAFVGAQLAIVLALTACAVDITTIHGRGPGGIQLGDGLSCFVAFSGGDAENCTLKVADVCVPSTRRGCGILPAWVRALVPGCGGGSTGGGGAGGTPPPGRTPPPLDEACGKIGTWYWNPAVAMDEGSARYEMEVTGKDDVRWEFRLNTDAPNGPKRTQGYDGCRNGAILEAKSGCNQWDARNHDRIRQQAIRQRQAADANGANGVIWYYADPKLPDDLRKWLQDRGVTLIHYPSTPPC